MQLPRWLPPPHGLRHRPALAHPDIYRLLLNQLEVTNAAPPPPVLLRATPLTNDLVELSWSSAADDHTPPAALTYEVRIGTQPGASDAMAPASDPATGFWRVRPGAVGARASYMVKHLGAGRYYWSVQAVDSGFKGSRWASESSFVISKPTLSPIPEIYTLPGVTSRPIPFTVSSSQGPEHITVTASADAPDLVPAVVADATLDDDEVVIRDIGSAAAYYLETSLKSGDVIGISSWSATLLAMVDAMHAVPGLKDIRVVQILGGVGSPTAEMHATRLVSRLGQLLHGEPVYLPAPGVVGSIESLKVLLQDPFIQASMDLINQVTIALVGIGEIKPSSLLATSGNVFSPGELEGLRSQGAVWDILVRFFDRRGGRRSSRRSPP